jgi:uncharacterized membrane-anchored protein YitT (DUF2179 family)
MKYIALFVLIQFVNIPLMVLGWFICLSPALAKFTWLWWNDEDQTGPSQKWWDQYVWLAWRNSVANFKHVPGVSGKGRPLWYRVWVIRGKTYYWKSGWMSNGFPALSAGPGRGW